MRWARGLILLLAVGSACGAALLVHQTVRRPAAPAQRPAAAPTIELLVAAKPIGIGEMVAETSTRWQPWPAYAVPPGSISRTVGAVSPAFISAPARHPLLEGEPIFAAKLAHREDGGIMAAMIAPGMRAVAVAVKDESAAGGFIQPNDRVDVIWTGRMSDLGRVKPAAKTLLRAVKVLAIGKALQARDSASADGRTATLELTPPQAQAIADAKAQGELSLSLVPAGEPDDVTASVYEAGDRHQTVPMLKFGRLAGPRGQN